MRVAHVVGSINRDLVAYVARLPAAGETVPGTRCATLPGGKGANQAVALARLGGRCRMIGGVGEDVFGAEMIAFLKAEGVDASGVATRAGVATGLALITVESGGQNTIAVVAGANAVWPQGPQLQELLGAHHVAAGDVVVCQLEIPQPIVHEAFAAARAVGATTLLNPAPFQPLPPTLLELTDILVLNETELAAMAAPQPGSGHDAPTLRDRVTHVLEMGPAVVLVTLGARGVYVQERGLMPLRIDGHRVEARDATGAGDCFVGAFATARLGGDDIARAARFANAAAALSTLRDGAAVSYPRRSEVEQFLQSGDVPAPT